MPLFVLNKNDSLFLIICLLFHIICPCYKVWEVCLSCDFNYWNFRKIISNFWYCSFHFNLYKLIKCLYRKHYFCILFSFFKCCFSTINILKYAKNIHNFLYSGIYNIMCHIYIFLLIIQVHYYVFFIVCEKVKLIKKLAVEISYQLFKMFMTWKFLMKTKNISMKNQK